MIYSLGTLLQNDGRPVYLNDVLPMVDGLRSYPAGESIPYGVLCCVVGGLAYRATSATLGTLAGVSVMRPLLRGTTGYATGDMVLLAARGHIVSGFADSGILAPMTTPNVYAGATLAMRGIFTASAVAGEVFALPARTRIVQVQGLDPATCILSVNL